jgi:SAM-dependent methyltransferase
LFSILLAAKEKSIKRLLLTTYTLLGVFGIDPRKAVYSIRGLPYYYRDLQKLRSQKKTAVKDFPFGSSYPCLGERFSEGGSAKGHYFHQDLLVARRIQLNNPSIHVDVGSRVDGFVAHVASFRPIDVLDIRPLSISIPNIRFVQADLMAPINDNLVDSCDSLSCLHALEHFGLGRYGDPVNYDGYVVGLNNLYKILKKGGKFYLSVPIGPQRIEFNAHRVFSVSYLVECFADKYHIDHFSFVDDRGDLHEDMPIFDASAQDNYGCLYGCGIFEMTKL